MNNEVMGRLANCQSAAAGKGSPVSAFGIELLADNHVLPVANRRESVFILVMRGLITFEVGKGMWMVPQQCALWIPGGMDRSFRGAGSLEFSGLLIAPEVQRELPNECCTMVVSPLLRELVIAASKWSTPYEGRRDIEHLTEVILDQIEAAPLERLYLPMPSDLRLLKIVDALYHTPSARVTAGEWARRIGMSERAFFRVVLKQTGMSFGRWRQQLQVMQAIKLLSKGKAVQTVALDLGYESASSFIAMFKKAMGQPPARYLAASKSLDE